MGDVFIRLAKITTPGVTVLDEEGNYNVYINDRLSYEEQKEVLDHELKHIEGDHFYDTRSVEELEKEAG